MESLVDRIKRWWCLRMHNAIMWPYGGHYRCRICLRQYAIEFDQVAEEPVVRPGNVLIPVAAHRRA